ncbi:MAG: sterol desaturase family protein [Bacteroidia bacterium]|nr:sterol desaturase family protein [Bacteroidia bacterium]
MLNLLIILMTYILMEGITWFTHKYIMHGIMWKFHEDHHDNRKKKHTFFEKNDIFFLIFAIPSMVMFLTGTIIAEYRFLIFIAAGITLYGITYFFIHDVLIHRRFRFLDKLDNRYFRALRRAHKAHHKHLGKEDGECFGLLLVPKKYFKDSNSVSITSKK